MLLFDFLVLSGFSYSIFGNLFNYLKIKNGIYENIKDAQNVKGLIMCVKESKLDMPVFVNTGTAGVGIPLGGGLRTEYNDILNLLRINKKNKFIKSIISESIWFVSYINTDKHLTKILNRYKLDKTEFPITLPIKIYETELNKVFYNDKFYDINKTRLYRKTLINNRLHLSNTIMCACVIITGLSWFYYKDIGYAYGKYPIFHPKRYYKYNIFKKN